MINELRKEFEIIQDDKLRSFAVEAISKFEHNFHSKDIAYIKDVVKYLSKLCSVIDAEGAAKDILIVAGLTHYLPFDEEVHGQLRGQYTRLALNDLMPIIGRDAFDNIMIIVERQKGFSTFFPELMPKIDDPIHIWLLPMAIHLAIYMDGVDE